MVKYLQKSKTDADEGSVKKKDKMWLWKMTNPAIINQVLLTRHAQMHTRLMVIQGQASKG